MNLFKGLEKFGLKTEGTENLFEEEKRTNASTEQGEAKEEIPSEESFLLEKSVRCTVCDKVFKTKMIKNGRVKRLEPDFDLRPRFMYIDTLKYDVASCPNCGYTAMNRYFEHLSSVQIKLIKEKICANFKPTGDSRCATRFCTPNPSPRSWTIPKKTSTPSATKAGNPPPSPAKDSAR